MNSRILAAALTGAVFAAGGCASSDVVRSDGESPAGEYVYSGASAVAVDSAENAVTWSDTVAVFTVVSERALSDESSEEESSSITGRRVMVQVDGVVWAREDGKQPPKSFETSAPGWYDVDGRPVPMRGETGIRLEVGKTYIAPVVYLFNEWGFDDSVLQVVDGQISTAKQQDFALATELGGKSLEEAAKVLLNARPLPEAGPLRGTTEEQLEAVGINLG